MLNPTLLKDVTDDLARVEDPFLETVGDLKKHVKEENGGLGLLAHILNEDVEHVEHYDSLKLDAIWLNRTLSAGVNEFLEEYKLDLDCGKELRYHFDLLEA